MKLIRPISINESNLLSSNLAETTLPAYQPGESYAAGAEVVDNHKKYTSLVDDNLGNSPGQFEDEMWSVGVAVNRWAMFDSKSRVVSSNSTSIIVQIRPMELFNALALINMVASSVSVKITDDTDGIVYQKTLDLQDNSLISSYYDWFFQPLAIKPNVVLFDLPAYASAIIEIEVTGDEVQIGELVVGTQRYLGALLYDYSIDLIDFSTTDRDDDGNINIVQKSYAHEVEFDLTVESSKVYDLKRTLSAYRAQGLVFVGDETRQESIIYGFITDFSVVVEGHLKSSCSLSIEELN